jgi:predicted Fe-S protein YdhL (DUF1289 family)
MRHEDESASGGPPEISSPCTGICMVSAVSGLCVGCGRTLQEIARWGALSEAERRAIMATLPARLSAPPEPP